MAFSTLTIADPSFPRPEATLSGVPVAFINNGEGISMAALAERPSLSEMVTA